MKADEARLHMEAAHNFFNIAQVNAEDREENLHRALRGYKKALRYFTLKKNRTELLFLL